MSGTISFGPSKHARGLRVLNSLIRTTGLSLVPQWRLEWWMGLPRFKVHDHEFVCFCHPYNCGFPPCRMTERAMELAVADWWLERSQREAVVEIGAVTPYYWPYRVSVVIDPYDPHRLITDRRSMFDVDLSGRDVLSISTLEHVGVGDYGPAREGESSSAAIEKVIREARRFLITVPQGVNPELDAWLFDSDHSSQGLRVAHMVRSDTGNDWRQVDSSRAIARPYVSTDFSQKAWANAVAIIDRSGS